MSSDPLRYQLLSDDQEAVAQAAESTFAGPTTAGAGEGWSGLLIPEDLGGGGGSATDLAVVVEALGATASASPVPWTLGVLATVLLAADTRPDSILAEIATGSVTASIPVPDNDALVSRRSADERVTGTFVALGHPHATLALPVVVDGADVLALVDPHQDGVTATPIAGLDPTRPWTSYVLQDVRLSDGSLHAVPGLAEIWRGAVAIYGGLDAAGTARTALERTVHYAQLREQFGRPLGSFQAYKHACATAFIDLKLAQSVSFRAASTSGEEATRYALASAVDATASATRVCMAAIQLHGGIGYSAESGLHRYLRRARADQLLVGRRQNLCALMQTLTG